MTIDEAKKILIRDNDDMRKGIFCINDFVAIETAIQALAEIQQYRAIGTVEGYENAINAYTETYILMKEYKSKLQDFESIGTVDEFKAFKEKSVAKNVIAKKDGDHTFYFCPKCKIVVGNSFTGHIAEYCKCCGQKLDWRWKEKKMRLIDADALMRDIIKRFGCKPYIEVGNKSEYVHNIIDEQPTAYDPDKVVETIDEALIEFNDGTSCTECVFKDVCDEGYEGCTEAMVAVCKDIVRKGG